MVPVDGKTRRRSGVADGPGQNLLAALDHTHGAVFGQVDVEAKANEIPLFATLLDRIDLAGAVTTADAMHAQRARGVPGHPARRALPDHSQGQPSPAYTPSSLSCPGARSRSPMTPADGATATPGGAP